jgi:microcystin-dependent protein
VTNVFIGEIRTYGFTFAPRGFSLCNGQILSIAQNTALFSLLGTTYGGNGQTTFALPDLRGRREVHFGQGPGLSDVVQGEVSGAENATLLITNMPAHTHVMTATMSASGLQPLASTPAPAAGSVLGHATDTSNNPTQAKPAIYCPSGTATPIALGGLNVSAAATGSSVPFSILDPFLGINKSIALEGIFPSRN